MTQPRDWDVRADELSAEAIGRGDPTAWFDELYAEGAAGQVSMPWDRTTPHPLLQEWADDASLDGTGRRAVVVGCGLGADAEYLASRGFDTAAFDLSPTAIGEARRRSPDSAVEYRVADLLDLPSKWHRAYDLVVEIFTLQAVPDPPREDMADAVTELVAPGGTLFAVAFRPDGADPADSGPPFPLSRGFMEGLARGGLEALRLEEHGPRWLATYQR
ncbi:class I SAM-dependent methyltransferase [Nocardioides sp. LHG3406-4]|uniref:class I SAM-dependent methyltransferase n=1 Tax=Nocardioides sp. LHG3406-4 TaxID=2804575 RepID=UPI003CF7C63C